MQWDLTRESIHNFSHMAFDLDSLPGGYRSKGGKVQPPAGHPADCNAPAIEGDLGMGQYQVGSMPWEPETEEQPLPWDDSLPALSEDVPVSDDGQNLTQEVTQTYANGVIQTQCFTKLHAYSKFILSMGTKLIETFLF